MKSEYKFHQYTKIEKGVTNSLIVDFLQEEAFQVSNVVMDCFLRKEYDKIAANIEMFIDSGLIINVTPNRWIPDSSSFIDTNSLFNQVYLEVENEADIPLVVKKMKDMPFSVIIQYGHKKRISPTLKNINIIRSEKLFTKCIEKNRKNGHFTVSSKLDYEFNKHYNSCWGRKIAVDKSLNVKPCIFSEIIVGNIINDRMKSIMSKLDFYWRLTKKTVEKCKDCEFKYLCFDCREIPFRKTQNVYSENPDCAYDPYTGEWDE